MSAQIYSTNVTQSSAGDVTRNDIADWLLLPGFLMSVSGIILLALGNWTLLDTMSRTFLLFLGTIFCFFGIIVIPSWLIYQSKALSERQTIKGEESA
jgi:purine-cytosine permease-like protein